MVASSFKFKYFKTVLYAFFFSIQSSSLSISCSITSASSFNFFSSSFFFFSLQPIALAFSYIFSVYELFPWNAETFMVLFHSPLSSKEKLIFSLRFRDTFVFGNSIFLFAVCSFQSLGTDPPQHNMVTYQYYYRYQHNSKMGNQCECPAQSPEGELGNISLTRINDEEHTRKFLANLEEVQKGFQSLETPPPFNKIKMEYQSKQNVPVLWKSSYPINCYIWRISEQTFTEKEALLEGKVGIFKLEEKENQPQIEYFYCGGIKDGEGFDESAIFMDKYEAKYEGSVENSKANGEGTYENPSLEYSYTGKWVNSIPHGQGKEAASKTIYIGEFFNGVKHGEGQFTFNKNTSYKGEIVNGKFDGQGTLQDESFIYKGQFDKGQKSGQGIWESKVNKQKYVGNFENGKKHGEGKYTFENGQEYEGEFKNDVPDGKGVLLKEKEKIEGFWVKGKNLVYRSIPL